MNIYKTIMNSLIILPLLFLISCEDKIIEEATNSNVTGQANIESCSSEISFSGLESISDVRDNSVTLNWQDNSESLGYSVFEVTNEDKLKLIKTIGTGNSSYKVVQLSSLSNYRFIVKSIDQNGLNDCNEKSSSVTTLDRETFKSCFDIQTFYGNSEPSGTYEIDVDLEGPKAPFNVYCEMDYKGGGWTRVFVHKTAGGLFSSKTEAKEKNTEDLNADLYSQLIHLGDFGRNGKFEFWLHYSELDGSSGGNWWSQTSNPLSEQIAGYTAINVDHTTQKWGGLEPDRGNNTLIDGSVGHSNWFYAIGAIRYWPRSGSIPGPSAGVNEVMLYIR